VFTDTAAVGAAIWSRRLVRTAVLKSETVDAVCVPVWLARASGSVANLLSAIAADALMSALTIVPSTRSAEVIVPPRSNLVLAIAAVADTSAFRIVPSRIFAELLHHLLGLLRQ
jgi:hypothetical protein